MELQSTTNTLPKEPLPTIMTSITKKKIRICFHST